MALRTSTSQEWDGQAAVSLHGLVAAARRQAPWLLGTAGLVVALTLLFTLRQRPVYEARASLRVEERQGQSNPTDVLTALQAPSSIETETEILRSRTVAADVADSLRLEGLTATELREELRVTRPQANAAILAVSYQSTDPRRAADVVNAVTRSYIRRRNQFQKQQASAAVAFLRDQVQAVGDELEWAESALEQFRRANVVIDPQAQAGEQVHRLADLRARQDELAAQRAQLRDLLVRARLPADSAGSWADFVGAPSLITSPAMSGIVQQLSTVEAERARLATWRTGADPDVVGLDRTIRVLRTRLSELVQSQLRGLNDAAHSADSTLAQFDVALQKVPTVELQYARLHRQVELDTQLYTLLQTRLKESEVSEAMEIANIQVVDSALVPVRPVGPRRLMSVLFGAAGGLLLGLLVALVREGSDTRVRSREEVLQLTEGPLLASIPRIVVANGHPKQMAEKIELRLVSRHSPRSPAAEAYRALRTSIAYSTTWRERPLKTLVVTSPEPRDGKTTTVVNLGITLAEQGHHVVLVGADQRRPMLHKVFHVARAPGLSEGLRGVASLHHIIHAVSLSDHARGTLDVIPAGKSIPNPAELLGSPAMPALLDALAARYDAVLVDTPPLGVVTDAAVLATLVDGVLFVARMGATRGEALRRSVEELQAMGTRVIGTVLTDVHRAADRYGHSYPYDQYYHYYGSNGDDSV
jgi:capsular exopolysaccharide synthesis family protein